MSDDPGSSPAARRAGDQHIRLDHRDPARHIVRLGVATGKLSEHRVALDEQDAASRDSRGHRQPHRPGGGAGIAYGVLSRRGQERGEKHGVGPGPVRAAGRLAQPQAAS